MTENSALEINLAAVHKNIDTLRRIVGPDCRVCPLIKADAYGLGAARIAKAMNAAGVDMLAVYSPAEASELIRKAVGGSLLVLMPVRNVDRIDELYRAMICDRLELAVHDRDHLENIIGIADRFGAAIPVHLKVDTGMSRGGCALDDAPELLRIIDRHPRLRLAGLFTHFADAETNERLADKQLERFNTLIEAESDSISKDCTIHAASTFATLRAARYHKSMVRIGLAWAGYGSETLTKGDVLPDATSLEPAVTWTSRIIQMRTIKRGATVGYGAQWTARRKSTIGLIPIGYADGFPVRAGATNAQRDAARIAVLLERNGEVTREYVPVVGAVSMDQITIDLTEMLRRTKAHDLVGVGTEVELITPDRDAPNHLPRLAEIGCTFAHELLSRLHPRLKRTYKQGVKGGNVKKSTSQKVNTDRQLRRGLDFDVLAC